MNQDILNIENQGFINININSDITKLLLKNLKFDGVSIKEIVTQIEAKKKCKTKLPIWFNTENIYYPNKINIEQTSSEVTAKYKSNLISGESLIDLTGGFGIDAYYFSKSFKNVTHCEINEELSQIVTHNLDALDINNIKTINTDGIEFLKNKNSIYDWVYLDPSRRHNTKGKVFFLKDCLPNAPEHLDLIFEHSNNVLIKTSPLLDIKAGLNELHSVKEIHIVALDNDVKELLWILEKGYTGAIKIETINIKKDVTQEFTFQMEEEPNAIASYSQPLSYLYEPNSALLKSGAFKLTSAKLKVNKLHVNAHLYTSDELISFPGRRFKIKKILPYTKKLLKKEFLESGANISIRNFSESVEQLKKKFNLKDGGNTYLFFTTDVNEQRIVLICFKV